MHQQDRHVLRKRGRTVHVEPAPHRCRTGGRLQPMRAATEDQDTLCGLPTDPDRVHGKVFAVRPFQGGVNVILHDETGSLA